ncbi:MAG: hypothetical protein CM15mV122_260 [uncultured marine virus]|nr:MAG: hypothetical protein CM15mV122_260 [uncultured marine virus]
MARCMGESYNDQRVPNTDQRLAVCCSVQKEIKKKKVD